MPAGKWNITIEQGAKFQLLFQLLNADETARDISLYTLRGKVREYYGAPTALASFVFEGVVDATGTATATIGATITETMPSLTGVYDIELALDSDTNDVERVLQGKAKITWEATS
jgi:hypothetical protein